MYPLAPSFLWAVDSVCGTRYTLQAFLKLTNFCCCCCFQKLQEEFVGNDARGAVEHNPSSEGSAAPATRGRPMVYDINKNISSPQEVKESQRIPGEKPFESSENVDEDMNTRKLPKDKTKRKDKELGVFPRPQRQFTLEEMIQDMMPLEGEFKESGDQRTLSPEPRFQAWL